MGEDAVKEASTHKYFNYALLAMGGITLLVALFGFCGAKKENQCLLSLYTIFVGVTAVFVRHNGDIDLLQNTGKASTLSCGSPAGHSADGALVVLLHAVGNADCCDVGSHADCALEGEHTNVVVDVEAVLLLVKADVGHGERLLVRIVLIEVVAANLNSQLGRGHTVTAVSSSDDLVGSNDGASAHKRTTDSTGQHDLVRELSRISISASHDPAATSGQGGREGLLREAARGGDCETSGDDNCGSHGEYSQVLPM